MRDNKKIRVVFLLPSLIAGGGIEAHTIKLLRYFDRSRFSFSLVTLFEHKDRPSLYDAVPSDVVVERLEFRGMGDMRRWKQLYAIFKKDTPDVVISSMFSANAVARILKLFFGYAVIAREHNTYEEKRMYHRVLDWLFSWNTECIVAVSSSVADFFAQQSWIARQKITVIHNGVDLEAIDAFLKTSPSERVRVREELSLAPHEKIFINVARLKPQKNHTLLIDAYALFLDKHPDYHLVILGDGVERQRLLEYVHTRNLDGKVHLLGYRSDVFAWYAASDFFVLTSKREGFPNVGIEAMAFGLPLVSTRVPGVDEFLVDGENGFSTESNAVDVADKMDKTVALFVNGEGSVRHTCRATAERFDIVRVTEKYEKIIESIL